MIKVTVEVIPLGKEEEKEWIGEVLIRNTGKHKRKPLYGSYEAKVTDNLGSMGVVIKEHYRPLGWIKLLSEILKKATRDE